jgi:transcriptional regulator with XRE-family HTH domain
LTLANHGGYDSGMRTKTLAEELKAWRDREGLTSAAAARRCEMIPQHYWAIEEGDRLDLRASTLLKLAKGTGLPLETIAEASLPAAVPA